MTVNVSGQGQALGSLDCLYEKFLQENNLSIHALSDETN